MADTRNYVDAVITKDSRGLTRLGFGTPFVLGYNAPWLTPERSRLYASGGDMVADGYAADDAEVRAVNAIMSQTPHPQNARVGRGLLPPTQVYILTPVVRNSHIYYVTVEGEGFSRTVLSITSAASPTAGTIVTQLIAAFNGVASKNYTATGTTTLVLTANAAGGWFSVEVSTVDDFAVAQTHVDPGVATDLAAIRLENDDFYCVYTMFNSFAYGSAVKDWVEANEKTALIDTNDSAVITTVAGGGDLVDTIASDAHARVMGNYHPSPASMFGAAWMGKVLPLDAGSETWFGKTLAGVPAVALTPTQRGNLVAKNGNSIERVAGRNVTFNGTTGDGDFIDIQRSIDWIKDDAIKSIADVIFNAPTKVAYTNKDVTKLEGALRGTFRRAINRVMIDETDASDDPPTPQSPQFITSRVEDMSVADRIARYFPGLEANGRLTGAVHKVGVRIILSR